MTKTSEQIQKIKDLFSFDEDLKTSKCKVENCKTVLKVSTTYSLKRHLVSVHNDIAAEIFELNEDEHPPAKKIKKIGVLIDANMYETACTKLVTKHGLPFNIFSFEGFRAIVDPIEEQLGVHITNRTIKTKISNTANVFQELIKNETRNKLISVKVDAATRLGRSIIGVNIQFIKNAKIIIRTLSMQEMLDEHTGENLKQHITDVLNNYGISPTAQLYSCTTDNGNNMLKAAELLQNGNSSFQLVDDDNLDINAEDMNTNSLPLSIRCSAHTLQLAVYDVIKSEVHRLKIEKLRSITSKLRTAKYARGFKKNKKTKPCLDNMTRWSSTYVMICSLLREEEYIKRLKTQQNAPFFMNNEWEYMKCFQEAFQPVTIATKQLQSASLTFGDFFKIWLQCKLQLEDLKDGNPLALNLLTKMEERQVKLFENDHFCSGIYIDSRFNFINSTYLSSFQKNRARVHLINTFNKIKSLKNTDGNTQQIIQTEGIVGSPKISRMEQYMRDIYDSNDGSSTSLISSNEFNIEQSLLNLCNVQRLCIDANIVDYWEAIKNDSPEMFELSQVVLAAPSTQVSVERAFSGLSYVLNEKRTSLESDILNTLLIVRLNSDLFDAVQS